jgi:hypothetical protein
MSSLYGGNPKSKKDIKKVKSKGVRGLKKDNPDERKPGKIKTSYYSDVTGNFYGSKKTRAKAESNFRSKGPQTGDYDKRINAPAGTKQKRPAPSMKELADRGMKAASFYYGKKKKK